MPTTARPDALSELDLRLVPAHDVSPAAVLRFESANREYFRRWIPNRGDTYYDLLTVTYSLHEARRWWHESIDRLHVVLDRDDDVVARANLVDVVDACADLGYRVSEEHAGQGIATAAVSDLLASAPLWGINRVRAMTSAVNPGSARVLERCGFAFVRTKGAALEVGGVPLDALEWEVWTNEPSRD